MDKKQIIIAAAIVVVLIILGFNFTSHPAEVIASPEQHWIWSDESQMYQEHHFYGESLHVEIQQPVQSYELIHIDTEEHYTFTAPELDKGIELETLPEGAYAVLVNQAHVQVAKGTKIAQTWYTITRDDEAKSVALGTKDTYLTLTIKTVKQLPKQVYDIIIDPGHGGMDTGTSGYGLFESEEMLRFSTYVAEKLEDKGFKVKLTRTTDVDPAGDETYNLEESPYYQHGRIEQVYRYQAKLFLSNHLNATHGALANGFQIYSSVRTTNELAQTMSTALQQVGMEPATHDDLGALGEGTFTKVDTCVERLEGKQSCRQPEEDYFYAIRESGGQLTSAQKLALYNFTYPAIPNFGAEGILVEYFFMNNLRESELWQQNWQTYADALVQAITDYLQ